MAEKEAHTTNKEALAPVARDRASGSEAGNAGRDWGRPAGAGATVPGTRVVPLDTQEPCLQLCLCDLGDDSPASPRTRS